MVPPTSPLPDEPPVPLQAARPRSPVSYSAAEEIAHSITHGLGIVLSIVGLATLITVAVRSGDVWHLVSFSVFGVTLILLYVASTLYHSIPSPRAKPILRILDHSAIYLLIAGTYTPFTLVSLRGPWGWGLLAGVWGLALFGILLEVTSLRRLRGLAIGLYLGMGWLVLIAAGPLTRAVAREGVMLLLSGGIVYTLGTVFYGWRRLPFHHAVWHLFVLTGSVLHFFAVLLYVTPDG